MKVGLLNRRPEYPEGFKVIDVLNLAFEEVYRIEKEMRVLEEEMQVLKEKELDRALKKYSELIQLCEVKGGYDTHEKLGKICKGLKLEDSFLNTEFHLLSGGEKTTVVLGKLLVDSPDILLLDEPTNHLDMESVEWLEGYLKNYKGIVVIVSHDRYFLDHVVTKIIEVEDKECETYKGNYSDFVRIKEENMRIQYEHYMEQQKKINSMEKSVKELRDWALRADNNKFFKRAASIQIKLDKMARIDKPVFERQNMKLNLKMVERSGNETIKAICLSKRYEDKVIFDETDLMVHYGERVALIGQNGSGKTTFLRMLLGEERSDSGVAQFGANVRVAYLPQKITFANEELTVLDCFREDISILEGKAREYLSKFMFYGSNVFKKIRYLSGGERIRLKLSKLLYEDINLLVLDEPTNHLDTNSIEALEEALEEFKGTIFFISHDRYFINKLGDRVIAIENFKLNSYPGDYDYYKNIKDELKLRELEVEEDKRKKSEQNPKAKVTNKPPQNDMNKVTDNSITNSMNHSTTNKITGKDIIAIEKKIEDLENEIKKIDITMTSLELDYVELDKLYQRKEELSKELDLIMETWIIYNN
jgi:ATPase subunit of ABC transporter with duplicated ATPase domains